MSLIKLLKSVQANFILPTDFQNAKHYIFDLHSKDSAFINLTELQQLQDTTQSLLLKHNADLGIGLYAEERFIYKDKNLFQAEQRNIHLGVDLTVPVDTAVYAPFDAVVHSFADNQQEGDYGPTIILQHEIGQNKFYTLYGHLSLRSLQKITVGQTIKSGESFTSVGHSDENGQWPAHLHFQIIADIGDYVGNYPGVCSMQEKEFYLHNCPDPNLILNLYS